MKREPAAIAESGPSEEHDRGHEDETLDPLDATPPGLQDAALINEIKKALQDLQDEMKKKDQEIEELRKKILVAEDYRKDMEAGIINIKGIDFNDMEPKDFEEWFNLFTSMKVAMDPVWYKILKQIMLDENGAKVKKELKQKDIKAVQKRLGIEERIETATNKMLYVNFLEYTKGEAHPKVMALGTEGASEAFRYVIAKGKKRKCDAQDGHCGRKQ